MENEQSEPEPRGLAPAGSSRPRQFVEAGRSENRRTPQQTYHGLEQAEPPSRHPGGQQQPGVVSEKSGRKTCAVPDEESS